MGWSSERYPRKKTSRKKSQEKREKRDKKRLEELTKSQTYRK